MHVRSESIKSTARLIFTDCSLSGAAPMRAQARTAEKPKAKAAARRREVKVGGKRVKTIDVHAHCVIPKAYALLGLKVPDHRGPGFDEGGPRRIAEMDVQGIDVEALSINPRWYGADRDLATQVIKIQNERLAEFCAIYPDRFIAFASVALQFPDLAVQQLVEGVKKLGLRGAAVGASVAGDEFSDPKFHPFWAKAEELGVMLFMHPQQAPGTTQNMRLGGKGGLGNTIGNPLETTVFLSHLIFEGTLDRFPGLKICGAHAGGYLPSYTGRSDAACGRGGGVGDDCRALKRKPSEYFRNELYIDTMVFREEGLRHLVAEVGADHIFYGTDYPFDWPVGIDFILNARMLSNAQKEAILGGNLVKLLRINT